MVGSFPKVVLGFVPSVAELSFTGGYFVACGGHNGLGFLDTCERYSYDAHKHGVGSWELLPEKIPRALSSAAAVAFDNYIYLFGGEDGNGYLATLFRLDTITRVWDTLTSMDWKKGDASAAMRTGKDGVVSIVVCGRRRGRRKSEPIGCDLYYPKTDQWDLFPTLTIPGEYFSLAHWNGSLFAVREQYVEEYDDRENKWIIKVRYHLPRNRSSFAVVLF